MRLDDKLPKNLLLALTLDVSDKRLRTLEKSDVTNYYYYAAKFLNTPPSQDKELLNSDLAVKWLLNAIQVLDRLDMCVGDTKVHQAIDQKFRSSLKVVENLIGGLVSKTVDYNDGDKNKREALTSLRAMADKIVPTDIKIWGLSEDKLDENISKYTQNTFLGEARTNEVRVYPLKEKLNYVRNAGTRREEQVPPHSPE